MKRPIHRALFALAVAAVAPSLAACGAEEEEGQGVQFPQSPVGTDDPTAPAGPGEAPTPINTVPVASQPLPPPPQEIVPGSTTEEEYSARPGDVAVGANDDEYTDSDPSALTDFRSTLDPYGSWVDDPNYGTVWTPSPSVVGDDFAPYVSAGRWTYDDAQNYVWVSDYDWGWAPFHYGRWAYLGSRWGWIPGREYAGAWVSWRYGYDGYDYLGWAPLPPRWGWRNGAAFGFGFYPRAPYVFCGTHDVFRPGIGGHLVSGGQVASVGAHTRVVASPTVGGANGRVAAHPTLGPSPRSIGLSPNEIARTPLNNRGVMHAQQFAHPATAQSLGAHASMSSFRASQPVASAPAYGQGSAYGRLQPVGQAPQYRGVAPSHYAFPSHTIGGGYAPPAYGGAPHYGTTYSSGRYSSPSYGGAYGGGGYRGPVYGGGAYGGYRGGGAVHSSNNSSNGSSSYEDPGPVVHHGGGGGGYSRGGGGFRGGGGGGHGGGGHR